MRPRMVEILSLQVDLAVAFAPVAQPFTMIYRRGPSLEFPPDPTQFTDKLRAVAYGLICLVNLLKRRFQFRREILPSVRPKPPVLVGILFYVILIVPIFIYVLPARLLGRFSFQTVFKCAKHSSTLPFECQHRIMIIYCNPAVDILNSL